METSAAEFRAIIDETIEAVRPRLSSFRRRNVDSWIEGGERWLALRQALAGAVAENVAIPGEPLDRLPAATEAALVERRMCQERVDLVAPALVALGRSVRGQGLPCAEVHAQLGADHLDH